VTRNGLPPTKLHEGRHTAATLGLESGVDLKTVSDQLGHSGIGITADLYAHVRRARHDEAAERVAQLLFPRHPDEHHAERDQLLGVSASPAGCSVPDQPDPHVVETSSGVLGNSLDCRQLGIRDGGPPRPCDR